jgi:adenylate kinase family enzyme
MKEGVGKQVMAILVGPPGSGKSTFAEAVLNAASGRPWARVCQVSSTRPLRANLLLSSEFDV